MQLSVRQRCSGDLEALVSRAPWATEVASEEYLAFERNRLDSRSKVKTGPGFSLAYAGASLH